MQRTSDAAGTSESATEASQEPALQGTTAAQTECQSLASKAQSILAQLTDNAAELTPAQERQMQAIRKILLA